MELMQSSKNLHKDEQDSSVSKLLKEKSSIAASMKSINDVIRYAHANHMPRNNLMILFPE